MGESTRVTNPARDFSHHRSSLREKRKTQKKTRDPWVSLIQPVLERFLIEANLWG